MELTKTQTYLYKLGFIQTQPNYYETPLNREVFATEEGGVVTYYKGLNEETGELNKVATSVVGDGEQDYTLVNSLR